MANYSGERDLLGRLIHTAGRRTAPPPADHERVLRASRVAWQQAVRRRKRRHWIQALAASVILALVAAGVLLRLDRGAVVTVGTLHVAEGGVFVGGTDGEAWHWLGTPGVQLPSGTRMRTDAGGRAAVQLDPATSLRIAPATDLLLHSRRRIELISGRIYLDSRASGGAAEILTRFGTLRDVGTQFEVLATRDGLRIRTREGAVMLTRPDSQEAFTCAFSEELRVDTLGRVDRGRIAPHDAEWSWAETLAEPPQGAQLPLRAFLEWVVRESGRRLRYDSPETEARAGRVILHGRTPNLAPVEALEVTLATTDFDFVLLDDGTILLRPRQAR